MVRAMSLEDVERRLTRVETVLEDVLNDMRDIIDDLADLREKVASLVGQSNTTLMLLKYVVTPLIIILGALVGVKIVFPT